MLGVGKTEIGKGVEEQRCCHMGKVLDIHPSPPLTSCAEVLGTGFIFLLPFTEAPIREISPNTAQT